jgi:hypothetical protein
MSTCWQNDVRVTVKECSRDRGYHPTHSHHTHQHIWLLRNLKGSTISCWGPRPPPPLHTRCTCTYRPSHRSAFSPTSTSSTTGCSGNLNGRAVSCLGSIHPPSSYLGYWQAIPPAPNHPPPPPRPHTSTSSTTGCSGNLNGRAVNCLGSSRPPRPSAEGIVAR